MNSIIETQRQIREELDLLEQSLVEALCTDVSKKSRKEQMYHEYVKANLLRDIQERVSKCVDIYDDQNGALSTELSAIAGPDEFTEFYNRVGEVKSYYRTERHLIEAPIDITYGEDDPKINKCLSTFTDEEGFGRFLDLHENHVQYINFARKNDIISDQNQNNVGLEYLSYLNVFDEYSHIPVVKRRCGQYRSYIEELKKTLIDYYHKCHPTLTLDDILQEPTTAFAQEFSTEGSFSEWSRDSEDGSGSSTFCVACKKQFTKESVFRSHFEGKRHKKAADKLIASGVSTIDLGAEQAKAEKLNREKDKPIIEAEFFVKYFGDKMNDQRLQTRMNVERKQARTAGEWEDESEEGDISEDEEEDELSQAALYNPKNLPLDWDGKRIPYWLYKLHGLSKYFTCEICDGAEYRGPKAFSKHFQEAKHAQGMKLLKIPNTIHFQNVTQKEEAKALWEKLKEDKKKVIFDANQEEEYEDSLGNVVSKRIYEDLVNNNLL